MVDGHFNGTRVHVCSIFHPLDTGLVNIIKGFNTQLYHHTYTHSCKRQELQGEDGVVRSLVATGEEQIRNTPAGANPEDEQKLHDGSDELFVIRSHDGDSKGNADSIEAAAAAT